MTSKEKEFVDVRDAVETVQRHLHLIILQNSLLKFLSEAKEKKKSRFNFYRKLFE